jgi:hypothetical protein
MKNKIKTIETTVSMKAINTLLIRTLAEKGKNDLEKFLFQQNLIQFLLIKLILLRTKLRDKKLEDWIERASLGNLIQIYKVCASQNEIEVSLIKLLNQYNKRRNYLIHKIVKNSNYKKVKDEAGNANKDGLEIIKSLEKLLKNELKRKIAKVGSIIKKVENLIAKNQ